MKKIPFSKYLALLVLAALISCKDKPKVITAQTNETNVENSGIFTESGDNSEFINSGDQSFTSDLHKVVVQDILLATKYAYLKVNESGKSFWIATGNKEISKGGTYFYRRGLLKTNFESKEFNRMFDTIYLVSNLVAENHGTNRQTPDSNFSDPVENADQKKDIPTHTEEIIPHQGSIKIAELVADPKEFEGKTIQITGKCVKINPNIMKRNWIHLQDGSKDDFDLVITSKTFVEVGKVVTMKAEVVLNRDFGAGYKYDLILENGIVVE